VTRFQIIAFFAGLAFLLVIVQLIRRHHLKEKYSLIWFLAALLLIVFAVWRSLVEILANLFGIDYAPAVLLLLLVFIGAGFFLAFSVIATKLSNRSRRLAQEVALLKNELAAMEGRAGGASDRRNDESGGATDQPADSS